MKCNKSEAERVKDLADEKLISGDVQAALKMALKAQSLFPSLPGLAQMIAAFNVHIAAATRRLPTGSTDWHAVLGVGPSDDLAAIKKQFRRMCVLTHPDKNPSAAADGAFKLIMEAWAVLSNLPADAPTAADSLAPPGPNTPPQRKPDRPYDHPPPPPAPTSDTFLCPHCFTAYNDHDAAGPDQRVVKCNHCGKSANRNPRWLGNHYSSTTTSPSSSQGKRSQQPNTCSPISKIRRTAETPLCSQAVCVACPRCGATSGEELLAGQWFDLKCMQCGSWTKIRVETRPLRVHYVAAPPPHPASSAQPSVRRTVECPTCGRTGKCLISTGRRCVVRCRGDGGEDHFFSVSG